MSLFLNNIPQPADNLDFSQGQLLTNNQGLDTVFGIDHFEFSDSTVNKGFHNTVTTPNYEATPPTMLPPVTVANPIFYGFQQTTPLGVLQYSRGPNNAVPTPVTALQSPVAPITLAPGATTNILDFTGISTVAIGTLYVTANFNGFGTAGQESLVVWTPGPVFSISPVVEGNLSVINSGNILQLKNNSGFATVSNIFWTLQFHRIQ